MTTVQEPERHRKVWRDYTPLALGWKGREFNTTLSWCLHGYGIVLKNAVTKRLFYYNIQKMKHNGLFLTPEYVSDSVDPSVQQTAALLQSLPVCCSPDAAPRAERQL